MPFIWNDINWKLVDDDDSYDESQFVVARKLQVMLNKGQNQTMVFFTKYA